MGRERGESPHTAPTRDQEVFNHNNTFTYLTLSLELIELMPSLSMPSKIDIQLLAVETILLLVEATRALERGPMAGTLGDTQHTITPLLLTAQIKA